MGISGDSSHSPVGIQTLQDSSSPCWIASTEHKTPENIVDKKSSFFPGRRQLTVAFCDRELTMHCSSQKECAEARFILFENCNAWSILSLNLGLKKSQDEPSVQTIET